MRRRKLSKKASRKNFSRGTKIKNRNNTTLAMRGGYRL